MQISPQNLNFDLKNKLTFEVVVQLLYKKFCLKNQVERKKNNDINNFKYKSRKNSQLRNGPGVSGSRRSMDVQIKICSN